MSRTRILIIALLGALCILPCAAQAATPHQIMVAQRHLRQLGFEVGAPDGARGPLTDRAICAFAHLAHQPMQLGSEPSLSLLQSLYHTNQLSAPWHKERRYLSANLDCQAMYVVTHHRYTRVIPISSGRRGFPSDKGTFHIYEKVPHIIESTEYKGGFMYKPLKYNGGEFVHGELSDADVYPYFASHGCLRVFRHDQQWLFKWMRVNDIVRVS